MTWQVLRSEFDSMMLENAVEHGAEVRMEVPVTDMLFEGEQAVGVRTAPTNGNGKEEEIRARLVIDATGRGGFLGRRLHIRIPDPQLKKMTYFAHFENAYRATGIDEGATLVFYIRENLGWFWWIPLHNNIVSIGVVSSPEVLQEGRPSEPVRVLDEEIELCPALKERLKEARRASKVYVLSDFSYRTQQAAGNGWLLVGDALGFLDPIYSSGVLLGLRSAELATDTIDEALQANDLSAKRLGTYGRKFLVGIEAFRKLVYAFYTPTFSFAEFVKNHPDQQGNLTSLLSGDVFREEVHEIFSYLGKYCAMPEPIYPEIGMAARNEM
jgi:flavin-dependent dehydrogenase